MAPMYAGMILALAVVAPMYTRCGALALSLSMDPIYAAEMIYALAASL